MNVIEIKFGEDLDSEAQNELRYRMELGEWRRKWRAADEASDHAAMDRLDDQYNMISLP